MTTDLKITAEDLTFGIEFETTMPAGSVRAGGYHRGAQVDWLPEGWNAQRDGSIRASGDRIGVEFVSPVLKGEEGLEQVIQVIAILNERGAKVNRSTGLHIHVGGFDNSCPKVVKRITTSLPISRKRFSLRPGQETANVVSGATRSSDTAIPTMPFVAPAAFVITF